MKLQELLNKFVISDFLITVSGLCVEFSFCQYKELKQMPSWSNYKNRNVKDVAILITNGQPELFIQLKEPERRQ